MKFAAPAAGGDNFTLLNSGGTALTGANIITVSGISNKDKLMILVIGASCAAAGAVVRIRPNNDANSVQMVRTDFYALSSYNAYNLDSFNSDFATLFVSIGQINNHHLSTLNGYCQIQGAAGAGLKPMIYGGSGKFVGADHASSQGAAIYNGAAIASVSVQSGSGSNFDAGTVFVYGSK